MPHAISQYKQKIFWIVIAILAAVSLAVLFSFVNNKQIADQAKTSVINGVGISPEPFGRRGISPEPFGRRGISPEPFGRNARRYR
ncbi:hypothetical protein HYW83_06405 [Candidatus Peregrinibacteria bacterium]|nr:hypothetical protein [Candidatus Peregrinibacteria bacterium]